MNDINNKENTVNENNSVKIEYVNPLNPNEILSSKNSSTKDIEEIKKVTEAVQTEVIQDDTPNEEIVMTKPKRKNKLLVIIVVLVALAIILASILLIPKIFKDDKKPIVDAPAQQNKINLSNIISNATNNIYYNFLTTKYTVNINEENDSIIFSLNSIDQTNPINKNIVFTLNNRDLIITLNTTEDNTDVLNAIYAICDSIGQYYGHDINEVGNYLYSMQNNYIFNVEGIVTNNVIDPNTGFNNGTAEILINLDTNISTTTLETMVFTLEDLTPNKNNIVNTSVNLKKGDLLLYTNNSSVYTIIVGQRKQLNDNTYNTINNVIELLYPEEINDFKSKFTSLSTISFDKYKITVDPVLNDNLFNEYKTNYKFISIEITKQA